MPSSPAAEDSAPSGDADRDEFMRQLQDYHNERGIGSRNIDLHRLYRRVTQEGGYDAVSDTRENKLMWRKLGQEFHLGSSAAPTLAFTLKTAYYKNLAAFEIQNFHKRQPPPKEILEEVTAKGGDLLNRTVENFSRPLTKEERLAESAGVDPSDLDRQSPQKDIGEAEDGGNVSGRTSRGLRQAPPPRQLFQGEVAQPRSTRQFSKEAASPAPSMDSSAKTNGVYGANGVPQSLAAYEPRPQLPAQLRPVMTPGNNYDKFKEEQKRIRDARAAYLKGNSARSKPPPGLVPPGTGFQGPTIYTRTLQSLQSGILEEQEYALYHLTKISHERGDRFRFDHFSGLAEALISKVLEVGSLTLDTEWAVTFRESTASQDPEQIIDQDQDASDISFTRKRKRNDKLEPEEFSRRMTLINEAALILRNMVMMDFNAEYVARFPTARALLVILLNLPRQANTTEIQQYGLDIAEQLTRYMTPHENDDQLFMSVVTYLDRPDRGMIIAALRAICRFGMIPQQAPPLSLIPSRVIQRLTSWMVLEDEDLRAAALDLLYQYTVRPSNVRMFLQSTNAPSFVSQLVRLLLHGAKYGETKETTSTSTLDSSVPASTSSPQKDLPIPLIPQPHVQHLLSYSEPERSSTWLRSCFIESIGGEITQIALWQAYQLPFAPFASTHPLLPAKDFITNVSNTFQKASAQVMTGENGAPRFVIKGIRPRAVPVDAKGRGFLKCLWRTPDSDVSMTNGPETASAKESDGCGAFARDARGLWEHIVTSHLHISKKPSTSPDDQGAEKWDFDPKPDTIYTCHWAGCHRFRRINSATPYQVGMHVKTHMPDTSEKSWQRHKFNVSPTNTDSSASDAITSKSPTAPTTTRTLITAHTALDERAEPAGLPLVACLVLRNLARNMHKLASVPQGAPDADVDNVNSPEVSPRALHREAVISSPTLSPKQVRKKREAEEMIEVCFGPVREQIFAVMSVNGTLKEGLNMLLVAIEGSALVA
ncbi:MAG: hypothetical protein Q9162_000523 [Coniocarpon cinnabarinum]